MTECLTRVEIHFQPEFVDHRLRFGEPIKCQDLDSQRAYAYFEPEQVFGYVRWEANEYGKQLWLFFVVKTQRENTTLNRIPGVNPGGEVLLHVSGKAAVKKALKVIDAIEALKIEPALVSPAYYRQTHNRLRTRQPIRPYTLEQHRAHLAFEKGVR